MKTTTQMMTMMIMAAGLAGAAVAQTSHQGHGTQPSATAQGARPMGQMDMSSMQQMMQSMMPSPNDPPSTKDFKAADMAMMKNMHAPYSGNPDVDFRRRMIPHHQGAIDMARVALQHAKDPATRKLAQKIIDDQQKEITEMQAWLKKNGG
jgi:uncharacterized protein (DUF305 family)